MECGCGGIHSAFHEITKNASITIISQVLAKIPVLIFAGDQDLICNYPGLESMIKKMTWNGATGLENPSSLSNVKRLVFIGDAEDKPSAAPVPGKTPEQDKAMWEAYYNAGSAALVLILIFVGIGTFMWYHLQRPGAVRLAGSEEESILLNVSRCEDEADAEAAVEEAQISFFNGNGIGWQGKGKERAIEPEVHEQTVGHGIWLCPRGFEAVEDGQRAEVGKTKFQTLNKA
ncbi:hypothetical protein C0992_011010 [Termitomyces sp. T32_za158]|nr:hypothetical protein C0992_011010 [Termitomyces sp. T32_za158]